VQRVDAVACLMREAWALQWLLIPLTCSQLCSLTAVATHQLTASCTQHFYGTWTSRADTQEAQGSADTAVDGQLMPLMLPPIAKKSCLCPGVRSALAPAIWALQVA